MAKTNEQFDQIFKEKLEGHQEKPSALAWERLESQLPKSSKSGWGHWWAIAASVSALLMVAYLYWPNSEELSEEVLVAQTEEIVEQVEGEDTTPVQQPVGALPEIQKDLTNVNPNSTSTPTPSVLKSAPKSETAPKPQIQKQEAKPDNYRNQSLVAEAQPTKEIQKNESLEIPEVKISEPELGLPELKAPDLTKTLAEAKTESNDEPLYRVNIYSNGIKKGEPADKNLITELGKTVGQVEGFLGKVDEGFAEIQDKKDNLFVSLNSKRAK